MTIDIRLARDEDVLALRDAHRREMNCQIVLDSWLGRHWVDPYLLHIDGMLAGYGLVGGVRADPKDTIVEFHVLPEQRGKSLSLFRRLIEVSGAELVEAQTNDVQLTLMLYDCARDIQSSVVIFNDKFPTDLKPPGVSFRKAMETDRAQMNDCDPDTSWVVECEGAVVASGGILCHYNPPYGDIFMATVEGYRRRGYGSYLVQELKRTCYATGLIPAGRCNAANVASRATLQRAGMIPCARVLVGALGDRIHNRHAVP